MINKSILRGQLFKHLDGLVTSPVAYSLYEKGIFEEIIRNSSSSLETLCQKFNANDGYLNVALRVAASQGFLSYHVDNITNTVTLEASPKTPYIQMYAKYYEPIVSIFKQANLYPITSFNEVSFPKLKYLFENYSNKYGMPQAENDLEKEVQEQVLVHIEGNLVAPIFVNLAMNGMFHKYFMETRFRPEEFHREPLPFSKILNFFVELDYFTEKNGFYQFTEKGLFFAKKATSYGVTVSYLPMFRKLDDLLFGDAASVRAIAEGEDETHVDREMNVWGSGGAHSTYFKVIDEIIIELFNRPIEEQPKGILDMGCGNGAFLQHIFDVIDRQTLRGKMLDEHPLFLVGADYNQAALKVTRANLINADIWAKVIWGDIGRPDLLAQDLKEFYDINLQDLLNVRTFLDHNRIWETPKEHILKSSSSTGAYAHRGKRISNTEIENNLLEHLTKWSPYVKKYGLITIELHTIAPEITAANLGKTAATAYDATHGFSDQYIVEIEVLQRIAQQAGLQTDQRISKKYPDTEYATVSVNFFKE